MKALTITIDGPSGAGKSTIARLLAKRLNYIYLDTGAMYRAVGLATLRAGIDPGDAQGVARVLQEIQLELRPGSQGTVVFLNGEDVSQEIRHPEVSLAASAVSALLPVRAHLTELQRRMGKSGGVVAEGRDTGTVVFPEAEAKFFITATAEERARRRFEELKARGEDISYEEVLRQQLLRDENDCRRELAPLKPAPEAIIIDTTKLSLEEVLERILDHLEELTASCPKSSS
ncbi:(d)CMP kinase [Thermosulfuriphilus sp.]